MKAKLRRLHSPDIHDLENYRPDRPDVFGFLLQAIVGPEGAEGEESFDMEVCTPLWLAETYSAEQVVVGRHLLIVQEYDYQRIAQTVVAFLDSCSGENWEELAGQISRLGKWEFEDYME